MKRKSRRKVIALLGIPASLAITRAVWAQTSTWTGSGPDNLWTDTANWDTGLVPISGSTAAFTNIASGFTNVSLGGANQPIGSITFTGSANSYNLGTNAGDAFTFDSGGSITAVSSVTNAQIISAAINTLGNFTISNSISNGATSGAGLTGLTVNAINMTGGGLLSISDNGPTETTALNGVISDVPGQPGSVAFLANVSAANNTIIINGFNTYSGTTSLMVTAQGTIQFSTDSPFGTGKISVFNTAQMQAIGGSHTISNAIDFNSGLNFTGTNTITLAGTLAIINPNSGGSRTFASNGTMTVNWGNPNAPSIFYLGNPVSNGGDGSNKAASFTYNQPATYIINDLLQNPGTGGGAVICTFTTGGTYAVNSLNTYTGATTFSGSGSGSLVVFNHSYVAGGTSGPFGLGTIVSNETSSNGVSLQPTGGNQTLANPITLTQGMTVTNAVGDNSGLTLAGNITMPANDRFIFNNLSGGSLTLGLATSPATLSLGRNLQILSQTNGVATVVNDLITDNGANAGGLNITRGLVQLTNPANTYSRLTTINAGVLSVSADGNLGSTTTNVNIVAGTLLSTGSFTTSRTINLDDPSLSTIDVASGNTLTLTTALGGTGAMSKGTSGGTLELAQTGGYSTTNNVTVNGGVLALGSASNGGATGPLVVGGTLTINNGGKFAVLASGATSFGLTNSVNSLQINGSGQLDLANSALITNTPYATVQQYLTNGYNSGAWNGTGGISSANAAADAALGTNGVGKALGFVSGTSNFGMNLGLASNQTMVKYTIYGDSNLDGIVNILDFGQFSANFGHTGVGWEEGDYNYDGVVNILDFGKLSANFGHSATATVAMGGASVNTLTGASSAKASASASTVKPAATPAGSGVSVVVNTTTGDVQLSFNNIQSRGYEIDSPSGEMNTFDQFDTPPGPAMLLSDGDSPPNDNRGNKYWIVLSSDGDPTRLAEGLNTGYHFSTLPTINQTFDLGDIYVGPSGTNVPDLSVLYVDGLGNGFQQVVQYVGVPEPTTLGLMGLAAAGLIGRRRKAGTPREN